MYPRSFLGQRTCFRCRATDNLLVNKRLDGSEMAKSGKTKKAASKRFKRTATGKLKFNRPGKRHLAQSKNRKRMRKLSKAGIVSDGDMKRMKRATGVC